MDKLQAYLVARSMTPWATPPGALEPRGNDLRAVVDHWLACRADIFDVGLGQMRYCLTDVDVAALVEHVNEWQQSDRSPERYVR